jgi:DNA-binding NtrC family response regulator
VLRDRQAFSLDAQETIVPDFRPIASAGPDLDAAVADGRLRGDFMERFAQVRIDLPQLRQRREDLPFLAACFLRQACEGLRAGPKQFSRAALTLLTALPWTGNGTELREVVTESVRNTHAPVIGLEDVLRHASLDRAGSGHPTSGLTLREARMNFERDCISAMLMRHPGRVGDAARALGIQRTNLYRKVRQLNVPRALLSARK